MDPDRAVVLKLPVRVLFVKIGFLGMTPLIEALLDERANREDIVVEVVSSGVKLKEEDAHSIVTPLQIHAVDLIVLVAPNAAESGPGWAWRELSKKGKPVVVVSDSPLKKSVTDLEGSGVGYIVVEADSMLGARREFLDATEMALFNSDIIRVLAITGVFRLVQKHVDQIIDALKEGKRPSLPRLIVDRDVVLTHGGFENPYAAAKALAGFEIAQRVGHLSAEGLYKVKERERYLPIVVAAHEMLRHASMLADEAREIEKSQDTVLRTVHLDDGKIASKVHLLDTLT